MKHYCLLLRLLFRLNMFGDISYKLHHAKIMEIMGEPWYIILVWSIEVL